MLFSYTTQSPNWKVQDFIWLADKISDYGNNTGYQNMTPSGCCQIFI